MKILVLGATGMLGYSLFSNLSELDNFDVYGTVRSIQGKEKFFAGTEHKLISNIDITDINSLKSNIVKLNPDVVLNCIGLIKQYEASKQHIAAIQINSLLPHQLAEICTEIEAKLIHFSTDCSFDGKKGLYTEADLPNSTDLYGKSKCLGEIDDQPHLTLRTSIIGHELASNVSLVDWFLSQEGEVNGFSKAVFSGLPTCYIAKVLAEHVLPNKELSGLYHLSVEPIDKHSLISLIADVYGKEIKINKHSDFVLDRSLDSSRFREATGFIPPTWQELVEYMSKDYNNRYKVS